MTTVDAAEVTFDLVIGKVIGPIFFCDTSLYRHPIASEMFIVAAMSAKINDQVILGFDELDEF